MSITIWNSRVRYVVLVLIYRVMHHTSAGFGTRNLVPQPLNQKTSNLVDNTSSAEVWYLATILRRPHVPLLISEIYCQGPLIDQVQKAGLFNDSKYFVDMALRTDPVTILRKFNELGETSKNRKVLQKFVDQHFSAPGSELKECDPDDWDPHPQNFYKIKDYHNRRWALALNRMWRDLCRQVKDEVRQHPDMFSLLYVPYPFIIPGGRFREFYYWDSYWILKGLLFSEMLVTARGIIRNLAYMVDGHGFVPNGGRVYYLYRSHPPLLIPMVYDYYIATGDVEFLHEILPLLEKEYMFWLTNRATHHHDENGTHILDYFQYRALMKGPRPESYREDLELTQNLTKIADKERVWSDIASAAETGWDFSTRWFAHDGPHAYQIKSIRTRSIVPVDLNAFMCMNSRMLASMFEVIGNFSKVLYYNEKYQRAKLEMLLFHWSEEDGTWYDFDLEKNEHVRKYYISNTLPLFAKCYDDESTPHRVYSNLRDVGALKSSKGMPTSMVDDSGQQWDSENAWPPMIHMVIEGFRTSGDRDLTIWAEKLANQWLEVNHKAYTQTHTMCEKYNVSMIDNFYCGGGGEYEVQTGFGWTNGVILDLLATYGTDASLNDDSDSSITSGSLYILSALVTAAFTIVLFFKFIG